MRLRKYFYVAFVICGIGLSCKERFVSEWSEDDYRNIQAAYCTNDIIAAEKALELHLITLSNYELNNGAGIDLDALRATDHRRLFLIYRKMGNSTAASNEFDQAIEFTRRSAVRRNAPPPPESITQDELAAMIELSEKGLDVQWKTNQ